MAQLPPVRTLWLPQSDNTSDQMLTVLAAHPPPAEGVAVPPPEMVYFDHRGIGDDWMAIALKTERRVLLLRMKPRVSPADCPKTTSLEEIVTILEASQKAGTARCYVSDDETIIADDDTETKRDEKNQIYIAQIKRDKTAGIISILVNRGNPNAVSPALLIPSSNDVAYVSPDAKQAPGTSAHLVISTDWTDGFHRAGFEKMPHVSTSLTSSAVDAIITRAISGNAKYTYDVAVKPKKKGDKPTTVKEKYRPILIFERMASEKLKSDLSTGELSGITLTKKVTSYAGPGQKDQVRYQEQKLLIHTAHKNKTTAEKLIADIEAFGKEKEYETITLHLHKLPHGQVSNPTLKLSDEEDALETLYHRAQILSDFGVLLEACYEDVCPEIEAKITKLINGG